MWWPDASCGSLADGSQPSDGPGVPSSQPRAWQRAQQHEWGGRAAPADARATGAAAAPAPAPSPSDAALPHSLLQPGAGQWHTKRRRRGAAGEAPQDAPQDRPAMWPPRAAVAPTAAAGRLQAAAACFPGADLWGDDGDSDDGGTDTAQQHHQQQQQQHQQQLWPGAQDSGGDPGPAGDDEGPAAAAFSEDGDGDGTPAAADLTWQAAASGEEAGMDESDDDLQRADQEDDSQPDEELATADFDASRDEVIARIEQLALSIVADAAGGQLPQLSCVSTASANVRMAPRHAAGAATPMEAAGGGAGALPAAGSLRLASQAGTQSDSMGGGGGGGGIAELHALLADLQPCAAAASNGGEYGSWAAGDYGMMMGPWHDGGGSNSQQQQQQQQQPAAAAAAGPRPGHANAPWFLQAGTEQQEEPDEDGGGSRVVRLGGRVCSRTLTANNGAQAASIVRVLQLLDSVHALLRSGRTATQRDVYYSLVGRAAFSRPRDVTSAIQAALGMLRVPRAALGISAAAKGAVAGCLLLRPRPSEPWLDCRTVGPSGRPIPGEVGALDALALRPAGAPRFILVVEKDAVFQGLVEARLWEDAPCIIITGRGMPDVASRAFLAALTEASAGWQGDGEPQGAAAAAWGGGSSSSSGALSVGLHGAAATSTSQPAPGGGIAFGLHPASASQTAAQQQQQQLWRPASRFTSQGAFAGGRQQQQRLVGQPLPVLGLVDWNPGGLAILLAYKCGSAALGLEAAQYAVPRLAWLGVTGAMLAEAGVPRERCHALTPRDASAIASLRARLAAAGCGAGWAAELDAMQAGGVKADIEALGLDALLAQLKRRVLVRQYLA